MNFPCKYTTIYFSHCLLCNVLKTILKPNFEKPIDTIEQLVERNITLAAWPASGVFWADHLNKSKNPSYRVVAKTIEVAESWAEFDNITKYKMLSKGTHAQIATFLYPWEMKWGKEYNHGRGWYRSKQVIPGFSPYGGLVTNKKWILNEDFSIHLLYFQQVDIY